MIIPILCYYNSFSFYIKCNPGQFLSFAQTVLPQSNHCSITPTPFNLTFTYSHSNLNKKHVVSLYMPLFQLFRLNCFALIKMKTPPIYFQHLVSAMGKSVTLKLKII